MYGRDRLELGDTNYSSEKCDCHKTMFHLQKNSQFFSKMYYADMYIKFSVWSYKIPRVNSLRKTCSHCYLQSLRFLSIFLPKKTFSPES